MTATREFFLMSNGMSVPWAEVPEWPVAEFISATAAELERGGRLCACFGVPENSGTHLVAVIAFDSENTLAVGRSTPVAKSYPKFGNSTASRPKVIPGSSPCGDKLAATRQLESFSR